MLNRIHPIRFLNVDEQSFLFLSRFVLGLVSITLGLFAVSLYLPFVAPQFTFNLSLICSVLVLFLMYTVLKIPIRLNSFLFFCGIFQIWITFTTFYANHDFGKPLYGDGSIRELFGLYLRFVFYAVFHLLGIGVAYYGVRVHRIIFNIFLSVACISMIIGLLQFLKFPPAVFLGNLYLSSSDYDIANWDGRGARSIGIDNWTSLFARHMLTGFALLVGYVGRQQNKWWQLILLFLFIVASLVAQNRMLYPLTLLCLLFFIYTLIKTKQPLQVASAFMMIGSIVGVFIFFYDRFSYALGANFQDSIIYRQVMLWEQGLNIVARRPWVGIGLEASFENATTSVVAMESKWTGSGSIDGGYILMMVWGGYTGLLLLLVAFIVIIRGLYRVNKQYDFNPYQRAFFAATVLNLGYIITSMYTENVIALTIPMLMISFISGLALGNLQFKIKKYDKITNIVSNRIASIG